MQRGEKLVAQKNQPNSSEKTCCLALREDDQALGFQCRVWKLIKRILLAFVSIREVHLFYDEGPETAERCEIMMLQSASFGAFLSSFSGSFFFAKAKAKPRETQQKTRRAASE